MEIRSQIFFVAQKISRPHLTCLGSLRSHQDLVPTFSSRTSQHQNSLKVFSLFCCCGEGEIRNLQFQYPDWIFYFFLNKFRNHKKCSIGLRISHESAPSAFFLSRKIYSRAHYFAERGRFELPKSFHPYRVSNAALSTTQPPLQIYFAINQICRYYSCTTKITITFFAFLSKNVILVCVFGLIV